MNNSKILTIKNAKFSGYYFYMDLNIWGDFQFCISVPLIWKLLSGVIADQIYEHFDQQKLLAEEQNGCRKRSRGTNDCFILIGQ